MVFHKLLKTLIKEIVHFVDTPHLLYSWYGNSGSTSVPSLIKGILEYDLVL